MSDGCTLTVMETVRDYLAKIGRRGAEATNKKLTPKQRKESARHAAQVRWAKQKDRKHQSRATTYLTHNPDTENRLVILPQNK
jgi:hypothetical protein